MKSHFGKYGGRYVPEMLIPALEELEDAYAAAKKDRVFHQNIGIGKIAENKLGTNEQNQRDVQ